MKTKKKSKLGIKRGNPRSGYWRTRADKAWAMAVAERAGQRCELCGGTPVEIHHLISRRVSRYRHDLSNGLALCAKCHRLDWQKSAHCSPVVFAQRVREKLPELWAWVQGARRMMASGGIYRADYREACRKLSGERND